MRDDNPPGQEARENPQSSTKKKKLSTQEKLARHFTPVEISTYDLIVDPMLNFITYPCCFLQACRKAAKCRCHGRKFELENCEKKLSEQLDIVNLIQKVNLTYGVIKQLTNKRMQ